MKTKLDRKPKRAARRSASSISTDMKRRVVQNDAVATTELYRGIGSIPTLNGVKIVSNAGHSGFVEFGTGPKHVLNPYTRRYSKPNFSDALVGALIEWASVKPSLITDNPVAVGHRAAMAISGRADDHVGGTDPQPFFVPAWKEGKPVLVNRVEDAVEDAVGGV